MFEKEKQSKERLLVKRFSRSFFRIRSSFKSSSQSSMIDSAIERASSVADSKISEREHQRSIRETSEKSSNAFINHYVSRMFQTYVEHSINDYDLWECITHDFANFRQKYWDMISSDLWEIIKKICYTQGFWIKHSEETDKKNNNKFKVMHNAVNSDYNENWIIEQIRWMKNQYRRLFSVIQIRKNEIIQNQKKNKLSINSNRLFNYHHRFNQLRHHLHQLRRSSSHLSHRLVTTRSIRIDIRTFETITSNQNYEIISRTFNHDTMIVANRIAFELVNMILNRTIMLKISLFLSQMLEIFISHSHSNLYRKSLIQKS
jgi:hypothetical protein